MIRYTITHVGGDGFRTFSLRNTGTSHYPTPEDAQSHLGAMLAANSAATLASVYGPHFITTARVDSVECYPHGDRKPGGISSLAIEYHPEMDMEEKDPKQREAMAKCVATINSDTGRFPILQSLKEPDQATP